MAEDHSPDQRDPFDDATSELCQWIARHIAELRAKHRWSVAELARRSGVPIEQLEQIEAAADPKMTLDTLDDIAEALGVDPQQLVTRRNDRMH